MAILSLLMIMSFACFFACGDSTALPNGEWGTVFTQETAYAKAQELGYEGSLEDFMESIKGEAGLGIKSVSVVNGELIVTYTDDSSASCGFVNSAAEKSAYQVYKEKYGYEGTKEEWVDDLVNGRLTAHLIFEVTFDSQGGNYTPTKQTLKYGEKIIKPTDPTKEGYNFNGWYYEIRIDSWNYDSGTWDFEEDLVTCSLVLTATWKSKSEYVPEDADPNKTIRVERVRNGYGDEWLNEIKVKFEAAFPGYHVDLRQSTNDMLGDTVVRLLYRGYNKTNTDLYVTGSVIDNMVDATNSYTPGTPLAADLTELVFNQKALDANGQEESLTVAEKLHPAMQKWVKNENDNAIYGMPYINSNGGLVVNKTNLAKFGYTELPRTSNELLEMATNIYLGKKVDGSNYSEGPATRSYMYPFTFYAGSQYGAGYYYTSIAQKDLDFYNTLMNFTTTDGTRLVNDGYELYKDNDLKSPLEMMYFSFDPEISARGSVSSTLDAVQAKLVSQAGDRAVFMFNGDWMLNEVSADYSNANDDLDFINFPVDSSIGVEVFSDKSAAEADKLLSYVIKLVDQNKTIEQIVSDVATNKGYTLTTAQAERIAKARGIYYSRGIEGRCFIAADSPKKELAAMFLRFMASEAASQTIAEKANSTSVFATTENTYTTVDFVKNASKISANRYATPIRWQPEGLRKEMRCSSIFFTTGQFLNKLWDERNTSMFAKGQLNGSTWEAVYAKNASDRLDAVYTLFKDNWSQRLVDNGIVS